METARPQVNGIIGMVNGELDIDEDKSASLETDVITPDSVCNEFSFKFKEYILNMNLSKTACFINFINYSLYWSIHLHAEYFHLLSSIFYKTRTTEALQVYVER